MAEGSKRCRECGKVLPYSEFYKHKQMLDGHLNKCKTCVKSRVRKHRQENLEQIKQYDRSRNDLPHRIEARRKYQKTNDYKKAHQLSNSKYRRSYNFKAKARSTLQYALKSGQIERLPCCICGNPKAEGHHEDYSRPIDVTWLCGFHHKQRHKEINKHNRGESDLQSIESFIDNRDKP